MSVGVGDRAPGLHAARHRRRDVLAVRLRRQAARARVLSGRRHAGVHQAAQRLQRRARPVRRPRRPGASASRPSPSTATTRSPASTASTSRCWPTPTRTVAAPYGTLGPIGFPRRSVFIIDADGVIRYAHRAIAGLTYRPVSELIDELAEAALIAARVEPVFAQTARSQRRPRACTACSASTPG